MKKILKNTLKSLFYNTSFLLRKDLVLLESSPDFSDNTKYVFDELLRRKINKTHKLFWIVQDKKNFRTVKIENVFFCNRSSLTFKILHFSAKYIIDSNTFITKIRKKQFRVHLGHGYPIKLTYDYSKEVGELDFFTSISPFFNKFFCELFSIDDSKIKITGSPRNDGFFNNEHFPVSSEIQREKTIIWMPTYRNHKNQATDSVQTGIQFPFGVPCINSDLDLKNLNSILRKNNVLLVLKLHPAENLSRIKSVKLSNIKLFDDSILKSGKIQLYDLLKDFDALITDYSSVYYDYLLTQNPIGLAIPDLKDFSENCAIVSDSYTDVVKGSYIYNIKDLENFIKNVATGNNPDKKELRWALNQYHTYKDGSSSKRIVNLVMEEMEKDK